MSSLSLVVQLLIKFEVKLAGFKVKLYLNVHDVCDPKYLV